jgi:hypothetical protein
MRSCKLGSGVLVIDALGPTCTFNVHTVAPLSIAFELSAWLRKDTQKHNIPICELSAARLTVTIDLQRTPAHELGHALQHGKKSGQGIITVIARHNLRDFGTAHAPRPTSMRCAPT